MSQYWSDFVHSLVPYVPGEQPGLDRLVKLNTNENPYPPSPRAVAAMQAAVGDALRLYPDPESHQLKRVVAEYYAVSPEQVFVGNGSDEVLAHVFHALLKHEKPILFPDITYSFYPVYCRLYGIPFAPVPLDDQFRLDFSQYTPNNGGIIFPNPNAPTGVPVSRSAIADLLAHHRSSVVVVDEAYVDFGGESAIPLVNTHPNLLVIQTLSKSRSLAGLRVGFAVGDAALIAGLERVKNSFNSYPLGRVAQAGACAAFEDEAYFQQTRHAVMQSREQLCVELVRLGFEVLPSAANFVFACHPQHDASVLAQRLREQAVIVRHFRLPRIEQFLRITVGSPEQQLALISALESILQ